uniref:Uncharacterized protein n=1 Tax=Anguilla anguilla TaxID=7936 RepID=A0A0E9T1A4_ANGAN
MLSLAILQLSSLSKSTKPNPF